MALERIDPIIYPWVKRHGLYIYTEHQGDEVRAIDVVDDSGDIYGLTIDSLREEDSVIVLAFERKIFGRKHRAQQTQAYTVTVDKLEHALELAYTLIMAWIQEKGHSRSIVC